MLETQSGPSWTMYGAGTGWKWPEMAMESFFFRFEHFLINRNERFKKPEMCGLGIQNMQNTIGIHIL